MTEMHLRYLILLFLRCVHFQYNYNRILIVSENVRLTDKFSSRTDRRILVDDLISLQKKKITPIADYYYDKID